MVDVDAQGHLLVAVERLVELQSFAPVAMSNACRPL